MSSARGPCLGSVAWAELVDSNGFRKVRPVVIVTPTAEIAHGGMVRFVAITTRLPATLPDDHVLLPWDRQGKARSGLRRRCAAVASWQAELPVSDVQQVVGILPPTVIGELLAKIAATLPEPPAGPPAAPGDSVAQDSESQAVVSPPAAEEDQGESAGNIP